MFWVITLILWHQMLRPTQLASRATQDKPSHLLRQLTGSRCRLSSGNSVSMAGNHSQTFQEQLRQPTVLRRQLRRMGMSIKRFLRTRAARLPQHLRRSRLEVRQRLPSRRYLIRKRRGKRPCVTLSNRPTWNRVTITRLRLLQVCLARSRWRRARSLSRIQ